MVFTQRPFGHTLAFCSSRDHLVQSSVIRHLWVPLRTGVVKTFRYVPLIEWLLDNINTLGQPIFAIPRSPLRPLARRSTLSTIFQLGSYHGRRKPNRMVPLLLRLLLMLAAPFCLRRAEHVACAGGGPVLSAGEITFFDGDVSEITNQSTGFCPEPESWTTVAAGLDAIPVNRPDDFTTRVVFRLCPACNERNIVKDGWFVCDLCGADLPETWNFPKAQRGT